MSKRVAAAALALPLLVALAGCTASSSHASATHTSSSTSSGSGSASASGSTSPVLASMAPAGTPLGAGERAWTAFSQRGLSHDAWWAHLEPLLSDSARAVYKYDDPRNIPSMKVTSRIHVAAKAPGQPRYTAEVVVPTSKGVFRLDLERHKLTSRWLLYAIKFPPGVH